MAAARALYASFASARPDQFDDPTLELLPSVFALPVKAVGPLARRIRPLDRLLRVALAGWLSHIASRGEAIDAILRDAIADGAEQLVILGSGLDTRAVRMPELSALQIFEVDRPDTHDYKAQRLAASGRSPSPATPVAMSLGEDPLQDRLTRAGFDPTKTTLWVWEGVTVYLTATVVADLLADVAGLSPPASRMVLTYVSIEDDRPWWFLPVAQTFSALVGEPFRGLLTTEKMLSMATAAGFDVVADDSPVAWLARQRPNRDRPVLERICVLRLP